MVPLFDQVAREQPTPVSRDDIAPLTFRDRFTVESLLQQAKTNDYKLRDLIVAICQSKTFQGNPIKSPASTTP